MNEEKKRILKLVEEGKLTSAEALTLLELLDKEQKQSEDKEKEIMNDVSTFVILDEEEKEQQHTQKKVASAKDMIFDFVDHLFAKVKDLDINFSKNVEVSHIFHQTDAHFKEFNVEVANGNVEFMSWDQPDVKVEVEAKVYRTDDPAEARKTLLEEISFDVKDSKMYFVVGQKWMKVNSRIFLPKETYEKGRIRLFNGSITGESIAVENLKAKTANGKIILSAVEGEEADLETANGNIELNGSHIRKVSGETLNGVIKSSGRFVYAGFETFNGAINIDGFNEEAQSLQVKSTTGSIQVTVPEKLPVEGEARANLGSLHVDLRGMNIVNEKSEVIQKNLKFTNDQPAELTIFADSKTGGISILHG
ncbi:DUF4097 family beta strand repeat-containing protein [Bacillus testis]|uniref:DUF4097 family beta strand repeat-containing protein n=1 Tax=Bacillus testis TaxID=1622072 RepID=UPI00067F33C3|nr:DUF4097 domain-containing protein [Bacillus testis]